MRQLNTASVLLRLLLTTILGGMIGMERDFKRCTAGTQTPDERALFLLQLNRGIKADALMELLRGMPGIISAPEL